MTACWQCISRSVGILGVSGCLRAKLIDERVRRANEMSPRAEAAHHRGDLFTVENVSARDVVVTGLTVRPAEKSGLLGSMQTYPFRVHAGDSVLNLAWARSTSHRRDFIIEGYLVGSKEAHSNRCMMPTVEV